MVQRYFWLAYMVLITLAAALGANIATSYISAKLSTPIAFESTQAHGTPHRPTQTISQDYAIIAQRNIFNANPPSNTPPPPVRRPPPVIQETIQETQMQLNLVGTIIGADDQHYAIIEDLKQRGVQALYQVGDAIQHALLIEIRSDCAVLEKNGTYETLCFPQKGKEAKAPEPRRRTAALLTSPQSAPAEEQDSIARIDNATWRVSREFMEQFTNIGTLSKMARVQPYIVQGRPQGFLLTRLRRNGILPKIGLQNGDVLQKVNGLSITSPEDALKAYQQLQQAGTVRLEILRRNSPTTLTYEIR